MASILREFVSLKYNKEAIIEAKEKKQAIVVPALLQRRDSPNQNKRIYPGPILEREMENYKKAIMEGRATGELDHPDSSVVSLENVSHVIREVWWKNDEVWGKVEILNTPKGRIAQDLMEAGVQLGISSRGVGDTIQDENGFDVVDESFMLIAFDLVSEPSTHEAWLMREGKQIDVSAIRQLIPKVDRVNRIVNQILGDK